MAALAKNMTALGQKVGGESTQAAAEGVDAANAFAKAAEDTTIAGIDTGEAADPFDAPVAGTEAAKNAADATSEYIIGAKDEVIETGEDTVDTADSEELSADTIELFALTSEASRDMTDLAKNSASLAYWNQALADGQLGIGGEGGPGGQGGGMAVLVQVARPEGVEAMVVTVEPMNTRGFREPVRNMAAPLAVTAVTLAMVARVDLVAAAVVVDSVIKRASVPTNPVAKATGGLRVPMVRQVMEPTMRALRGSAAEMAVTVRVTTLQVEVGKVVLAMVGLFSLTRAERSY